MSRLMPCSGRLGHGATNTHGMLFRSNEIPFRKTRELFLVAADNSQVGPTIKILTAREPATSSLGEKKITQQSSPMGLFFRGDTPSFSCSEKIPRTQTLCIFNDFTPWQQRHCPCSRYHISHRPGKGASCHCLQGLGSAPMRISNFIHFIWRLLFCIQRSFTWFCVQWSVAESPIIIGWILTIPETRKGWPRKVNPFKRLLLFESNLGDLWAQCGESLRETLMCMSAISWL